MKRLLFALPLLIVLGCAADTVVGPQESDRVLEPAHVKCNPNVQPC